MFSLCSRFSIDLWTTTSQGESSVIIPVLNGAACACRRLMAFRMWSAGVQEQHPFSGENPFTSDFKGKISYRIAIPSFAFVGFHPPFVVDHNTYSPYMPHFLIYTRRIIFPLYHPFSEACGRCCLSLYVSSELA